ARQKRDAARLREAGGADMSCADRAAKDGIADITKKCDAVSVAFAGETPYVIPMSFGFEWEGEGEKVSRMRQNGRALAAVSVWKNDVRQIGGKWRKHL
ncbi:MAG: hypothetical protein ACLVJB_09215, partial [Christensenellales bacterium]